MASVHGRRTGWFNGGIGDRLPGVAVILRDLKKQRLAILIGNLVLAYP